MRHSKNFRKEVFGCARLLMQLARFIFALFATIHCASVEIKLNVFRVCSCRHVL